MTILNSIPFLASPYCTTGRGAPLTDIVLHWMDGTLATTDAEFTSGSRHVSAHFGIEGTTIHQYVALGDTAWHAGDWNENQRSIGIEHSAAPGRDATAATIATSIALQAALCRKEGINPDHIYPHNKFFGTQCPGTLPLVAMVASVRAQLANPTPPPARKAPDMAVIQSPSGAIYVTDGFQKRHVQTMAEVQDWLKATGQTAGTVKVTQVTINNLAGAA